MLSLAAEDIQQNAMLLDLFSDVQRVMQFGTLIFGVRELERYHVSFFWRSNNLSTDFGFLFVC